jgi:SAM-dependent methyltransferase
MTPAAGNIAYTTPAIEAFYREHRVRWEQFYESERVVLAELGLSAASCVLDIGCGCGGLGLALRERFGVTDYTGVEINGRAAETARRMNPHGRFICGDILNVGPQQLRAASFDLVVSLSCIDWNLQFEQMLADAYRYVRPGGYFLASFRLTPADSLVDIRKSYQYINFEGRREGEVAPYVVLNVGTLLRELLALAPARIRGFGYWGSPSATAVTVLGRVGFAVIAVQKGDQAGQSTRMELDLPTDLLRAACRE